MIKMIIADDERLIRESLNLLMDWESVGVEVICVAENGQEALELIRKHDPDILLSDISMPQMDGIELIQKIKEEQIGCKVIFLSAYSNFVYAQNAVKYGAFDFILKPIDEYELMDTVKRCVDLLKKEREMVVPLSDEKAERRMVNAALVNLLMDTASPTEDDQAVLRHLGIDSAGRGIAIGALLVNGNIMKDVGNGDALCPAGVTGNIVDLPGGERILLWISESIGRDQIAAAFYAAIRKQDRSLTEVFLSAPHSMKDIRKVYPECAFTRLYLRLGFETSSHRYTDGKVIIDEKYPVVPAEALVSAIHGKNPAEIKTLTDRIFWRYAQQGKIYDRDYMRLKCIEYLDSLKDVLYLSDDSARNAENDVLITSKKLINIQNSVYDIYDAMLSSLMRCCSFIESVEDFKGTHLIAQAIALIKENYRNITLASAAEKLYVSPTYLSRAFTAERKETFSRYLQKYRMKVAKKLLLDPQYKIYTVSEMVGYSDVAHFSKAFKQIEGVSPKRFKNLSGGADATE